MSNINAVIKSFQCSNCDTFFNRTSNLQRHSAFCSERVKHVYPKNVYQIRETLFDKLNCFWIEYRKEQALFKNLAVFDFEFLYMQKESFKDSVTTKLIGNHIPISVSISSNLVEQPIFLCNADPHYLIASFIAALGNLAFHGKVQMKTLFLDIETAKNLTGWNFGNSQWTSKLWTSHWNWRCLISKRWDWQLRFYSVPLIAEKTTEWSARTFGTLL